MTPQDTHLERLSAEAEASPETPAAVRKSSPLEERAEELAGLLQWLPNSPSSHTFAERSQAVARAFHPIFNELRLPPRSPMSDDWRWLHDNERLLYTELHNVSALKKLIKTPHVRNVKGVIVPRVLALAESFCEAVSFRFSEQDFYSFFEAFQRTTVLQLRELRALPSALELVLLEEVAARGAALIGGKGDASVGIGTCVKSLQQITQAPWKDILDPLIAVDGILRLDPAGAYELMDFESRELYRTRIADLAEHSDSSETAVAEAALALAREASRRPQDDPRVALRQSHVGYYVINQGSRSLAQKIGFRAPVVQKIQGLLRDYPDEFFLLGIAILTFAIASAATLLLTDPSSSLLFIAFSLLIFFLPSSQSAVQLMNYLVTSVLPPQVLPKLDFSEAVPDDCPTLVAVPSLLLNEKQVHGLIEDLEVRFLGNHDPNIHFALLTDLPDAREPAREDSGLIALCSELIEALNKKYAHQGMGTFLLLHRHRVYNPREKSWMGWERKRGKLLDLNKFLRGQYDSFPVKVGDMSILPRVRFVITLDSDTELPRGTAHRLIGTLAHPLNQAVVDPAKNIVVAGYGILQPRVGVSVQSTARSRLAAIYAGETGFDIYTRATSDAYQDLYGEGSFTGKGIYEVDTLYRVLDRRFPRNSLLSHDLIEGAYARAGLVSDIEVIEDYPSHYSAHNRRKHRWLRGDWQIAGWLRSYVPEESGDRVANPMSMISRWKILDNLRRSLVEPATFLLLVVGWLVAARAPWEWTLVTLCILFVPTWFQLAANVVRALFAEEVVASVRDALGGFYAANVNLFFTLTFLAHQTLVSLDAVVRVLVRRMFTQQRLLEWETAAEAELGAKGPAPIDVYLNWMPVFSLALGLSVWAFRPRSLFAALPILVLWASNKLVSLWLNRAPEARYKASVKDVRFLRRCAVSTWRYFAEFSTAEHNWLVPDNVQEEPPAVAARVSPTNVGLLLNARQAACEFGYLTATEFVETTKQTLATIASLQKQHGHLLNWYDTRSLEPLAPLFVSSVDSGNLMASLWSLQQGCLDQLYRPVLQPSLAEGCLDYLRLLAMARLLPRKVLARYERQNHTDDWLQSILEFPDNVLEQASRSAPAQASADSLWVVREAGARVENVRRLVADFSPWLSPEFSALRRDPLLNLPLMDSAPLEQLPDFIDELMVRIDKALSSLPPEQKSLYMKLREKLTGAQAAASALITDLKFLAAESGKLADAMDFTFLYNSRRKLLSIGFQAASDSLEPSCYDLLATESRTAIFVAIAKEDIPQESWFALGRAQTLAKGRSVLLSWTGTMFEYLMPSLWMRSFPNTLLDRSCEGAVRAQQEYGDRKDVPWGISESAYAKTDEAGNYQYYAFGLSSLALRKPEINRLVISPYSTFLSLGVDPAGALKNLRRMSGLRWAGPYGFYESADFSGDEKKFWRGNRCQLVRSWMAHHQGMTLVALANFMHDNVFQRWFHAERRVLATELLLHEKPIGYVQRIGMPRSADAA